MTQAVEAASRVVEWISKNTVRIPAFVLAAIGALMEFEVIAWTSSQTSTFMIFVAATLALVTGKTVTANARIGDGSVWGSIFGKEDSA